LKPKIFIGSSASAKKFAGAIHDGLVETAECTTWTEGAFGLSKSTIDNLIKNLRDSDFGIFVFAPDDVATIKGDLLNVTRDNVVYEAGLFAGYLSPQRCFIVIPRTAKIHIPSDLLGMMLGFYEDNRTDKNYTSAVSGFCRQVDEEIQRQGLFLGHPHERLRELSVKFECCDWIADDPNPNDPSRTRVDRKKQVSAEIDAFCRDSPVNKYRLLNRHTVGYYIALLSAIRFNPEGSDDALMKEMKLALLKPGFTQYKVLDAVEALKDGNHITRDQLKDLQAWFQSLPGLSGAIKSRVDALIS
jgi:hypothetical protein